MDLNELAAAAMMARDDGDSAATVPGSKAGAGSASMNARQQQQQQQRSQHQPPQLHYQPPPQLYQHHPAGIFAGASGSPTTASAANGSTGSNAGMMALPTLPPLPPPSFSNAMGSAVHGGHHSEQHRDDYNAASALHGLTTSSAAPYASNNGDIFLHLQQQQQQQQPNHTPYYASALHTLPTLPGLVFDGVRSRLEDGSESSTTTHSTPDTLYPIFEDGSVGSHTLSSSLNKSQFDHLTLHGPLSTHSPTSSFTSILQSPTSASLPVPFPQIPVYPQHYGNNGLASTSTSGTSDMQRSVAPTKRSNTAASQVPAKKPKGRRPSSGVENKSYKCPDPGCAWSFSRREHLKRHEKTHSQDRPFVCDVPLCELRFSRLDNLTTHKKTHEKGKRTSQWHDAKVAGSQASPLDSTYPVALDDISTSYDPSSMPNSATTSFSLDTTSTTALGDNISPLHLQYPMASLDGTHPFQQNSLSVLDGVDSFPPSSSNPRKRRAARTARKPYIQHTPDYEDNDDNADENSHDDDYLVHV